MGPGKSLNFADPLRTGSTDWECVLLPSSPCGLLVELNRSQGVRTLGQQPLLIDSPAFETGKDWCYPDLQESLVVQNSKRLWILQVPTSSEVLPLNSNPHLADWYQQRPYPCCSMIQATKNQNRRYSCCQSVVATELRMAG